MSNSSSWQVAPHGILMFVLFALGLVLMVHLLGFSIVGTLKVGK